MSEKSEEIRVTVIEPKCLKELDKATLVVDPKSEEWRELVEKMGGEMIVINPSESPTYINPFEIPEQEQDEVVQYLVVNKGLKMSAPKMGAQIGHAVESIVLEWQHDPLFKLWRESYSRKKIVMEGKQKDLERLVSQGFTPVIDNGLTEIPPGSLTVVGLPPMWKSDAKKYMKRLQVYKDKEPAPS